MICRHCKNDKLYPFLDLGVQPPSNAYLSKHQLLEKEPKFPLKVSFCKTCYLVQTEDFTAPETLFTSEYAYFSSTSQSWLAYAELYSNEIIRRLGLGENSFVVEIASNDGYLLANFIKAKIPCLGIEPTLSTAKVAINQGIEVIQEFFGKNLSNQIVASHKKADLIIANNVYAHVPNINDFTKGIKNLLSKEGVITLEVPHLLNLVKKKQFDTIYHEHFSYFSLTAIKNIFEAFDLRIFDVDVLSTHGGSLRIYGCHKNNGKLATSSSVASILKTEKSFKLHTVGAYKNFQKEISKIKDDFLQTLINIKNENKIVLGYGAAAKGNTLINYAGVKADLLPVVFDAAASKQWKYLPGSQIPIIPPEKLYNRKVDYILILPWNIKSEIKLQVKKMIKGEVKFITAIPKLEIT